MSDDNTQDDAEPSPASAGSHGAASRWNGVPVAWAAVARNGQPLWLSYHQRDAEGAVVGMADVIPLYRHPQPALTDEERWAITEAAGAYFDNDNDEECAKIAATLHGLLKRLG